MSVDDEPHASRERCRVRPFGPPRHLSWVALVLLSSCMADELSDAAVSSTTMPSSDGDPTDGEADPSLASTSMPGTGTSDGAVDTEAATSEASTGEWTDADNGGETDTSSSDATATGSGEEGMDTGGVTGPDDSESSVDDDDSGASSSAESTDGDDSSADTSDDGQATMSSTDADTSDAETTSADDSTSDDASTTDSASSDATSEDADGEEDDSSTSGDDRPDIPRLRAPLSIGYVANRVELQWFPGRDATHTQVQVCRDRDCQDVIADERVATADLVVGPLDPGIYYWKAWSWVIDGADATQNPEASETWAFRVDHRRGRSHFGRASVPDFDADGHAELVIGDAGWPTSRRPILHVHSSTMDEQLIGRGYPHEDFARLAINAGDLDGDGRPDLVTVMDNDPERIFAGARATRELSIYPGHPDGLADEREHRFALPFGQALVDLAPAFDFDRDGWGDIVVVQAAPTGPARPHVYFGPLSGEGVESEALPLVDGSGGAEQIVGLGDFDGDGYADIGIRDDLDISIVFGGVRRSSGSAARDLLNLGAFDVIVPAGDIDGDGYDDVIGHRRLVPGERHASASVFFGQPSRVDAPDEGMLELPLTVGVDPDTCSPWGTTPPCVFTVGHMIAAAGDLDADGFGDLVVAAKTRADPPGRAYVYRGSANRDELLVSSDELLDPKLWEFAERAFIVPDLDGDGRDEVAVTSRHYGGSGCHSGIIPATVQVYEGRVDALGPDASTTHYGSACDSSTFGANVLGALLP